MATNVGGGIGGHVPATLARTLGPAIQLGSFTPGVTRTCTASTTANVISSASDAASLGLTQLVGTTPLVNGWLHSAAAVLHLALEVVLDRTGLEQSVTISMWQLVNSTTRSVRDVPSKA